jgi:hypothetical protein
MQYNEVAFSEHTAMMASTPEVLNRSSIGHFDSLEPSL